MEEIKSRYYTVQQIKQLEGCGKDKAYEIANELPHENRGKKYMYLQKIMTIIINKKEKEHLKKKEC